MDMQEFISKYGTRTASMIIRHLADSPRVGDAVRNEAHQLACDLQAALESERDKSTI